MSTKTITDAFRMKKRLHSGVEKLKGDVSSRISRNGLKSPEVLLKSPVIKKNDPNEGIKTPTRPAVSRNCDESPVSTQANTPLRFTYYSSQDCANEIVWDFNSPEYRKHLKSIRKQNGSEIKNIEAIIKQISKDDIQSPNNSLLNLWMKSNRDDEASENRDDITEISPVKNHQSRVSVSDELAKLLHEIEETADQPPCADRFDYLKSTQSVAQSAEIPQSPIFDAPLFTPKKPFIKELNGFGDDLNDIWEDDDLFCDDTFIQQTQLTEEEYFSKQSKTKMEVEGKNDNLSAVPDSNFTTKRNLNNITGNFKSDLTDESAVQISEDFEMEDFYSEIYEKAESTKENINLKCPSITTNQGNVKNQGPMPYSSSSKNNLPYTLLQKKTPDPQPKASTSFSLNKSKPVPISLNSAVNKVNESKDCQKTPTANKNYNLKSNSQYKFKKNPSGVKINSTPKPFQKIPKYMSKTVNIKEQVIESPRNQVFNEIKSEDCSELLCNDEDFFQPEVLSMLDQLDTDPGLTNSQGKNEEVLGAFKCSQEEIARKREAALKRRKAKRHDIIS